MAQEEEVAGADLDDWLEQTPSAIETALGYHRDHGDEIDSWISRNEEAAEAAERVALARRAAS